MRRILVAATALLFVACASLDGLSTGNPAPAADASAGVEADSGQDGATSTSDAALPIDAVTLSITRPGTGKGVVVGPEIDCGSTCSHAFARGASVPLNAAPLPDSAFTGWGTPCSGTGNCLLTMVGDVTLAANFVATVLDVDGNKLYESDYDAKLISRYMFGLTDVSLTMGAIGMNATRKDPDAVIAYLTMIRPQLDIDGDAAVDALTDGILITRYMSGTRGDALTTNATAPGATRNGAQIEAYLKSLMP